MRISQQAYLTKELQKTLLYSDMFDYPLSGEQLYRFSGVSLSGKEFLEVAKTLPHVIWNKTIYYFLPKRKKIVTTRIRREKISVKKMQNVKKAIHLLSFLPTIQLIGVSGSLALFDADTTDDSDLFIITKKNTLWITRLFIYIYIQLIGRKRGKKNIAQSLCVNMFLDESRLQLEKQKHNLYIAHEVMQMVPLINKNGTYEKFLSSNVWIKKFFPNIQLPKKIKNTFSLWSLLLPVEYIVRVAQLIYMDSKKTREVTTATTIAFHPIDYERILLAAYEKKKKRYGL